MATYAKVDIRIWNDKKVMKLTPIQPCGQGLWIRLLVSEHRTSLPGVLKVGEAALAEEFGWSPEDFRKAFAEASSLDLVKADWKARFVWIPNVCEYNQPESPNVVKSWRIPWDEAPECPLKDEAYWRLKSFIEGFGEGFRKAFAKSCPEPSPNQEQDQEQDQEQEHIPPSAGAQARSNVNAKSANDWYALFCKKQWEKFGRQYGQGESDAKATGKLHDLLESLPLDQRAGDWINRERIVEEFLARSEPKTVSAGWSFSFFVNDFRGLAIPPDKRPAAARGSSAPHNLRVGQARAEDADHSKTGDLNI
jgi:hypothetical protein